MIKNASKSLVFPLLLVFYEITTYLSNDMYLPALPQMMKELHLTTQQIQLSLTAWFIGSASMPIVMGILSDRYGRRKVLLSGGLVYILSSVGCALSTNLHLLLLSRFIQGTAIPSMMVPGYACIHELYEQKEAVKILALMGSVTIIAPALGPLIGSIILLLSSWRGIFWVIAILGAIAIALLYKWMPDTQKDQPLKTINVKELFHQYGRVISNARFMTLLFSVGFNFCGWLCWIAAGSLLVIEYFHYSTITFSLMQAAIFVIYIVGNQFVKNLIERWEINRLVHRGLILTLLGAVLCYLGGEIFPNNLFLFVGFFMIFSFGSAFCYSPLSRLVIEASDESMGVRMSLLTMSITFFAALASILSASFFNGSILSLARLVLFSTLMSCGFKVLSIFTRKDAVNV